MSVKTKNVFIECTAVDLHKANVVLNTMLTMFAQYCSKPFEYEYLIIVCDLYKEFLS
jgi:phenylalanyl-tRNA synthetase beta chain